MCNTSFRLNSKRHSFYTFKYRPFQLDDIYKCVSAVNNKIEVLNVVIQFITSRRSFKRSNLKIRFCLSLEHTAGGKAVVKFVMFRYSFIDSHFTFLIECENSFFFSLQIAPYRTLALNLNHLNSLKEPSSVSLFDLMAYKRVCISIFFLSPLTFCWKEKSITVNVMWN